MQRVEKIKNLTYNKKPYPCDIRIQLLKHGCVGEDGNFEIEYEYPEAIIKQISNIISKHDGLYNQYKMWYCEPIQSWRLVYGRS